MGTRDSGIFEDDVALDVRVTFEEALAEGLDVDAATRRVLEEFATYVNDVDDGPLVWFALAALQLEQGALQAEVRRQALAAIERGTNLARWTEQGDPDLLAARRRALEELRGGLLAARAAGEV